MAENTVPVRGTPQNVATRSDTREPEEYMVPPVDIYEEDDTLVVVADVPGARKGALEVQVQDDLLTMKAPVETPSYGSEVWHEFDLRTYYRQFRLTDTVDTANIRADLKNGVLTIRLPKAERLKPKKIAVTVA